MGADVSKDLAVREEDDGGGDAISEEENRGHETLGAGVLRQVVKGAAREKTLWKAMKEKLSVFAFVPLTSF